MEKGKRASIAGKNVDLYLESAFANQTGRGKSIINVTARKRRDINPNAPYAGGYVTNSEITRHNGSKGVAHNQIITRASYNKIQAVNHRPPLSQAALDKAAEATERDRKAGKKVKPLATGRDGLAFKSNIFSDDKHPGPHGSWNHIFNQRTILPPSKPFDYAKESALNSAAREAKAAKAKPAVAASKEKAPEPEL